MPSRKNSGRCFSESLSSLIFRWHGCCCSIVEPPGPISGCATFNLHAQQLDDNVWDCFSRLTGFSHESLEARLTSSVPLGKGGLGLQFTSEKLPIGKVGWLARRAASCFTAVRGCVQLWLTWVPSHRCGSRCSSMLDLSWKRRRTQHSRRLVGRRKGYHKLDNIICRLSSGPPCLNLSGPSGVLIRVHWPLWSSWLCPPPGPPELSHSCSACSCLVGFGFHGPSLPAAADVAVSMTSLATIAQPVRKLGFSVVGVMHWSLRALR